MNNTEINLETFADNINSADIENKNYKDSVFRMLFSDKAELLTLYNAINGSNYTNVDDLEINTLDKGVFLKMRNDVSFIFNFELNLYEHQSTVCGNMPIRDFLYAAEKIHSMLKGKDLHSRVMLKIPTPRFVVFYNGENDLPDVSTQKLSDHFEKIVESPELELVVTTLNININRNKKLMEGCKTLKEYSLFVNKVRYYINEYKVTDSEDKKVMIAKAVSAAIDD